MAVYCARCNDLTTFYIYQIIRFLCLCCVMSRSTSDLIDVFASDVPAKVTRLGTVSMPNSRPHMCTESGGDVILSVVLACYNEAECVVDLAVELDTVLNELDLVSEVLFINDASTDETLHTLNYLRQQYPRVRVISHAFRCGQSAGQATGFRYARGELIVTLDADGQNDPRDIPRLLAAIQYADAVSGWRRHRQDHWTKRAASRLANAFRNVVTGDYVTDAGCAYRILRRESLHEIPVFDGLHRFLPTLLRLQGFRVVELEINHRPRSGGMSKYGIHNRLWRGLLDCLGMCWLRWRMIPGNRIVSVETNRSSAMTPIEWTRDGNQSA